MNSWSKFDIKHLPKLKVRVTNLHSVTGYGATDDVSLNGPV